MKENRWARVPITTLICATCAAWVLGGCGNKQQEENKVDVKPVVEDKVAVTSIP